MNCVRCGADRPKDFTAEVAIHTPGLKGLNKPIVWVFPRLKACLNCGFVEFVLPGAQIKQLKNGEVSTHSATAA